MDSVKSIEAFLFELPLYAQVTIDFELTTVLLEFSKSVSDGYCHRCGRLSTFSTRTSKNWRGDSESLKEHINTFSVGFHSVEAVCARSSSHVYKYWFFMGKGYIIKTGQFPSLADIANDEAAHYRSTLDRDDASELHKAIGLAAHGVGIGSFVYLRRIFERLIKKRFDDHREIRVRTH